MRLPWFKPWGWFYRPIRWPAWIVVGLAAAFCVHLFLFYDARVHSVTDLLYHLYPFVVPTWLVVDWVARRTTESPDRAEVR